MASAVAVCQVGTRPGAVEDNLVELTVATAEAAAAGAGVVVLPELAPGGYVLDERVDELAEPLDGPSVAALRSLAAHHEVVLVAGFAERDGDRLYNSAVVIDADGALSAHYRKLHLFGQEKRWFEPGDRGLPVAETAIGRVAVCVCYDLRFPEVARLAALRDAALLAVPTAWIGGFDRSAAAPPALCAQATGALVQANLNQVYIACASQCGRPGDHEFLGNSLIADPYGEPVGGPCGAAERAVVVAPLDPAELARARRRSDLVTPRDDRRGDVYAIRYDDQDF